MTNNKSEHAQGGSRGGVGTDNCEADSNPSDFDFDDFYDFLGISEDADKQQIKKAYQELVSQYHPDHTDLEDSNLARIRFQQASEAKEVLIDGHKREQYDRLGHNTFTKQSSDCTEVVVKDSISFDPTVGTEEAQQTPTKPPAGKNHTISSRGATIRNGSSTVVDKDKVFNSQSVGGDEDGNTVYEAIFSREGFEGRSLKYAHRAWARSWRNRLIAAVVLTLLGFVGNIVTGTPSATPQSSPHQYAAIFIASACIYTLYDGLLIEHSLPRGDLIRDNSNSRGFSDGKHGHTRVAISVLVLSLFIFYAHSTRQSPWGALSQTVHGTPPKSLYWLPSPAETLPPLVPAAVSVVVLILLFVSATALTRATSLKVWTLRYNNGVPVRHSVTDLGLMALFLATPLGLIAPETEVYTAPPISIQHEGATAFLSFGPEGAITTGTLATVSFCTLFFSYLVPSSDPA
jgi:hypothetical protein